MQYFQTIFYFLGPFVSCTIYNMLMGFKTLGLSSTSGLFLGCVFSHVHIINLILRKGAVVPICNIILLCHMGYRLVLYMQWFNVCEWLSYYIYNWVIISSSLPVTANHHLRHFCFYSWEIQEEKWFGHEILI